MVGVDTASKGLALAASLGVETSPCGVDWLLEQTELPEIVFEATSARVHTENAPRYREAVGRRQDLDARGVRTVRHSVDQPHGVLRGAEPQYGGSCGGQATIPLVLMAGFSVSAFRTPRSLPLSLPVLPAPARVPISMSSPELRHRA